MDQFNSSGTFYEGVFTPYGNSAPAKPDLSKLSKDELVALAQDKGLETEGTKADLAARLEAADQG